MTDAPRPEFSRPFATARLRRGPATVEIAADAAERAGLARRFGLLALDRLSARLSLEPDARGALLRLSGTLSAEATQACVVTLEPVRSRIEESFALLFAPDADAAASRAREVVVDPEAEDPPEAIGPAGLDLGEAVAQQLAVALDPYPRAADAELPRPARAPAAGESAPDGPFAALAALKRRR